MSGCQSKPVTACCPYLRLQHQNYGESLAKIPQLVRLQPITLLQVETIQKMNNHSTTILRTIWQPCIKLKRD